MAGFRKDTTTSANTAIMTAGAEVAALLAAGVVQTVEDAVAAGEAIFDSYLAKAQPVVDADNALFASVEGEGVASGKSGKPVAVAANPGDQVFQGGKFKGCSIAEVYAMTPEQATEKGHTYGAGATYIVNYVATDKNTNETTRTAAKAFLAAAA